ncbi:MAG: sigma-70 family RNA polymerase sigma factor [Planctomycetes bacterium]|nr:sigma-70 family RNA polymerase sigma factor [Planctomycetota bacterium]
MSLRSGDVEAALKDDRWIRRLAAGLIRDGSEADDALQEARLALMRSQPPCVASPRSWLARVALNFLRKHRREESRRKRRERRAARPERFDASPQEAMERVELRQHVLEAVLALDEPYRSTLVLRFFEEMSLRDIAGAARIPVNTVKTRLSRALRILRRRLEARYGGRGAWAVPLLPFLPPGLRTASALGTGSAAAKGAVGSGIISVGATTMSIKGIAVAVGISGILILGGFAVIRRSMDMPADRPPVGTAAASGTDASRSGGAKLRASVAGADGREDPARAPDGGSIQDPVTATVDASSPNAEAEDDAPPATSPPSAPATPEALAVREAFRLLKGRFGEGGRTGWSAVGENIARLQELIVDGPEGFWEFLALLDDEADDSFLEAVLHHLPMAGTDVRQGILDHQDLRQQIWARYEEAQDPARRAAFLRFFAFNRALSASRMDDFLALAPSEPDQQVRQIAIDAIASNPDLIAETWQVLAQTVEYDPDLECKETAIRGLAFAEADGARALVRAAFTSPDERLRAAALGSAAGDRVPDGMTEGEAIARLIEEFRTAQTPRYKTAILERFVGNPREVFAEEIRRALPEERNMGLRKEYAEALRRIEEASAARPQ